MRRFRPLAGTAAACTVLCHSMPAEQDTRQTSALFALPAQAEASHQKRSPSSIIWPTSSSTFAACSAAETPKADDPNTAGQW